MSAIAGIRMKNPAHPGGFVKSAADIVGKLLPQVQVSTFQPGELESAIDFAGGFDPGENVHDSPVAQ